MHRNASQCPAAHCWCHHPIQRFVKFHTMNNLKWQELFSAQILQITPSNIHEDHSVNPNCGNEISPTYYVWSRRPENEPGDPECINVPACHHFKQKRFHFSRHDLHPSLVTLSLSLLSKATNIRGKANMGQGQSPALTEHKYITSGMNYQGITQCAAPCHRVSHNRFKQVENVFRGEGGKICQSAQKHSRAVNDQKRDSFHD